MKKIVLLGSLLLAFTACHSQENQTKKGHGSTTTHKTTKGNWTVHKEYDDQGNLIAKDSVYSYSWSSASKNGHPLPQAKVDSLFKSMHQRLHAQFGGMNLPEGFDFDSLEESFFGQN